MMAGIENCSLFPMCFLVVVGGGGGGGGGVCDGGHVI